MVGLGGREKRIELRAIANRLEGGGLETAI